MPSNVVSPILLLLLIVLLPFSCTVSMHACNARHIGIPGFQFEHQKLLGHQPGLQIEVNVEEELRESLLSSKFTEPIYSSTGNEDIMSPSSQIDRATEWKAIRRQVGEVTAEPGLRDGTVDDDDDDDALDPVDTDVGQDTVVMDYAQPHRKPPIHNEKP